MQKSLFFFAGLFLFGSWPAVACNYQSIQELHQLGLIAVNVESVGGYQGECIHVIVRNRSTDSVHAWIEAGRKFNSLNDAEQDILVVKSRRFSLAGQATDTLPVTGYCCQSSKHSPEKKSAFGLGVLAPASWLILVNLIDQFDFQPAAIQHAIWVLSDQHDIRSIPAFSNPEMDQLRHTVARILDVELPWYSFTYAEDEQQLFTGRKTHLFAEVPFTIPFQALIGIQVTDRYGRLVHEAYSGSYKAGNHTLRVEVPVETWSGDEYYLSITEDFHTINKRLVFSLNADEE